MHSSSKLLVAAASMLLSSAAVAADRHVVIMQALTGSGSFAGAPVSEGIKFGLDEINASGFLGADKIKYTVVDDASDRGQATSGVARFAQDPNILMVVGPTIGPTGIASSAVANEQKFPIMPLTNAMAVLNAGPWSFIASQPAPVTMPLLGDYALNVAKVKTCAMIVFADNEAYTALAKLFRDHVEPKGLKIVDYAGIKTSDSDFSAIATRIVRLKPDCVMLFVSHAPAANIAIQLKEAGLDPGTKLIGQSALSSADLIKIGGAAVEGLVFTADWVPGGFNDMSRKFVEGFRKATNREPDNWNAMGYSLAHVVASAIKNAGPNPTRESVREALTRSRDIPIVMGAGAYSLDDQRVPRYGVVFLTIKGGKFVRLEN